VRRRFRCDDDRVASYLLYKLFPPGRDQNNRCAKAARDALSTMGPLTRDEWIVAVAFAFMVTGWVMAGTLNLSLAAVARWPGALLQPMSSH